MYRTSLLPLIPGLLWLKYKYLIIYDTQSHLTVCKQITDDNWNYDCLISNTWCHLTESKEINSGSYKNGTYKLFAYDWLIGLVVECSSMAWVTGVQSQVESYQRLKKWYLIPSFLTLSIIRCISRVKWSEQYKERSIAPPHLSVVAFEKGAFG